jgi:hypothetical protein
MYAAPAYIEIDFCQFQILHKWLQINKNSRSICAAAAYIESQNSQAVRQTTTPRTQAFTGLLIIRQRLSPVSATSDTPGAPICKFTVLAHFPITIK